METGDPLKSGGINSIQVLKDSVWICRDNGVSGIISPAGAGKPSRPADGLLSNTVFFRHGR